jgi:hypothetical protein
MVDMGNPSHLSDAAVELELIMSQVKSTQNVMLVFNYRENNITAGDIHFIEEMFDIEARIKDIKGFNTLTVNAANG